MELERSENTRIVELYRTQNEVLDTQNRQCMDKIASMETSQKENLTELRELREENLSLKQSNGGYNIADIQNGEMIQALQRQIETKTTDLERMASEMGKTNEKLNETKTQWVLAKDQLRLVEEALREVRSAKQEDEQRWLTELDSCKKRLREVETSVAKKDEMLDDLRFTNRSLTAEIAELKKDSACMGQMLEDEVTKVDRIAERERNLHLSQTELKI